jgi:hypothetical protein
VIITLILFNVLTPFFIIIGYISNKEEKEQIEQRWKEFNDQLQQFQSSSSEKIKNLFQALPYEYQPHACYQMLCKLWIEPQNQDVMNLVNECCNHFLALERELQW